MLIIDHRCNFQAKIGKKALFLCRETYFMNENELFYKKNRLSLALLRESCIFAIGNELSC